MSNFDDTVKLVRLVNSHFLVYVLFPLMDAKVERITEVAIKSRNQLKCREKLHFKWPRQWFSIMALFGRWIKSEDLENVPSAVLG